jgi:putative colanic acid biosynthesis acetyltransferase WcaF
MNSSLNKSHISSPVFGWKNKAVRVLWRMVYLFFFRFTPVPFFLFRRLVLKIMGADVHSNVRVYPSVDIWLPSNLVLEENCTLGPIVKVYNQGKIFIGRHSIISQGAHLCASTHDYNNSLHPLVLDSIVIESDVWVCADAFVGPGAHLSAGTVVGARAVISKKTEPWSVYAGNPAKKIKDRVNFSSEMDVKPQ